MSRRSMNWGLILVVGVSLYAAIASSASAQQFHAEVSPIVLKGNNEAFSPFTFDGGTVECQLTVYEGTRSFTTATTQSLSVVARTNCTGFGGFVTVEFSMNGCEYLFHVTQNGTNTGTTDIVCPSGKEITIVSSSFGTTKCTIHVPAQTGLGTITYTNVGSGTTRELIIDISVISGLQYSQTAGSGFGACAAAGGTKNGQISDTLRLTAQADFGSLQHVGTYVE